MKYLNKYIIIGIVGILSACSEEKSSNEEQMTLISESNEIVVTKDQFMDSNMELTQMSMQPFSDELLINGKLDVPPEYKAAVSAYFGGYVKSISILPGQQIKKGQTLFMLENPEFIKMQEAFLENSGQLAFLKNDYERKEALWKDNVSSEKEYLKAKADYESAKARVASLKNQLGLVNINTRNLSSENIRSVVRITAPIGGYINAVHAEKGKYLEPRDVAVMITNPDHMHVELNVYEKDYDKLSIGQELTFQLQNKPNINYPAKVYLINRYIENDHRIVKVHGHLIDESKNKELVPGMYLEAQLKTSKSKMHALPETAIINIDKEYYALKLEKQTDSSYTFSKKLVDVGNLSNDYRPLLNSDSFDENTQFLSKGAFSLISE
jgi:cobalt-zinc-cadmium efflux system membrane fusion protein